MQPKNEPTAPKNGQFLMPGTGAGSKYLCVARVGNIGLGVKMLEIVAGTLMKAPEHTYLSGRLRSTDVSEMLGLESEHPISGIELAKAWPDIKFGKVNAERASVVFGAFIRGSLDVEQATGTLDKLLLPQSMTRIADFIVRVAGKHNMLMSYEDLIEGILDQIAPMVVDLRGRLAEHVEKLAHNKATYSKIDEALGDTVGFQAAQMKSLYGLLHGDTESPDEHNDDDNHDEDKPEDGEEV